MTIWKFHLKTTDEQFITDHNDRGHREDYLRIREVKALESIAVALARRAV